MYNVLMRTSTESWRPCVGFEAFYEVSDSGRVRRIAAAQGAVPGKILKPQRHGRGYLKVSFTISRSHFNQYVHRLVATAFLGPCPPGHEVNHKDRVRSNNTLANLEWMARSENRNNGGMPPIRRGEDNGSSKLTEGQVRRIIALRGQVSQSVLAREYGVHQSLISLIQLRRAWSSVVV